MSQIAQIPVPNDATVPTLYYETMYKPIGSDNYTTQYDNSPLPLVAVVSPAGMVPYVQIQVPLADATAYEYMMRRFDNNGNSSTYFTGNFTTP